MIGPAARHPLRLDLLGAIVVIAILAALHGPLALHPATLEARGPFHPGHAWCFDHIARMFAGEVPFAVTTDRVGFPAVVSTPFIAWVPALVAVPLNALFGPLAAYNLAFLACTGLPVFAMAALARGRGAAPPAATLAGVLFALAPPVIGALANGQTCKAQVWVVPAVLAAVGCVVTRGSLGAWACLLLVTVAGAFSEPTYALLLGLAVPLWALLDLPVKPGAAWLRAGGAVGLVAVVFLAAARYYDVDPATSAFLPSVRLGDVGDVTQASQQASLLGLVGLGAGGRVEIGPTGTSHVVYLGVPAILLALFAAARVSAGRRDRAAVLLLAVLGVAVSLGEHLVVDHEVTRVAGNVLQLPDLLLARAGFPLARSGQYYRAVLLAWAGVALALALAPLGRLRVVIATLLVLDGLRVTAPLWPFPTRAVPGRAAWAAIAADPAPGAVLDLPLSVGNLNLGDAMLAGALHGRPVQAIPVFQPLRDHPLFRANLPWIADSLPGMRPDEARARLRAAGFAFVTWRPVVREGGPTREDLVRMFGPPRVDGEVSWWKVSE